MKKIITAVVVSVVVIFAATGCNDIKNYKSDETTLYNGRYFSFELNNDYKILDDLYSTGECTVTSDINKLGDINIREKRENYTCSAFRDANQKVLSMLDAKDIEYEVITDLPFDGLSLHYTIDDVAFSNYHFFSEGRTLTISTENKAKKRELAKEYLHDIVSTLKYTDDFRLPDSPQTIENSFYSVSFQPPWNADVPEKNNNGTFTTCEIKLGAAETLLDTEPMIRITAKTDYSGITADDDAECAFQKYNSDYFNSDVNIENTEFNGSEAVKVSASSKNVISRNDFSLIHNDYFIGLNGILYEVDTTIADTSSEEIKASMDNILSNISFAQLSDEDIRNVEASASTQSYSLNNMNFEMKQRYVKKTADDSLKEMIFECENPSVTLYIKCNGNQFYYDDDPVQKYFDTCKYAYASETEMITVGGHKTRHIRIDIDNSDIYEIAMEDKYSELATLTFDYQKEESTIVKNDIQSILDSISFSN